MKVGTLRFPTTPESRYFVHKDCLWRCTNPGLDEVVRQRFVKELMASSREVAATRRVSNTATLITAREKGHVTEVSLGERGPILWNDDTDCNRHLIKNTPYKDQQFKFASAVAKTILENRRSGFRF